MGKWKEAVTTQLNDAARKNKKLREELRLLREEKANALSELRVQLTEEFQERTAMQRDELEALKKQTATLREEKKTMAATHEAELQATRMKLREVIQLELETEYKRREEGWEKEKTQLQMLTAAKETERAQAEHECGVLQLRLSRLGTHYDELATLLQPEGGVTAETRVLEAGDHAANGTRPESASATAAGASGTGSAALDTNGSNAERQKMAMAAAHARQIESIKADLQSKQQHTQFLLGRTKQQHEAEKTQLLRELHLREEELKVAHTLLKQVQAENSRYMERVSHAQAERQALEQRYAAKVSALSQELAERTHAMDEAQLANKRLQEQLRNSQQQVATLEEESTMREEAFHSLMFSEDSKRITMDLQRAVQAARDEAEEWKMQYYASVTASQPPPAAAAATSQGGPSPQKSAEADSEHESAAATASAAAVRTPEAWHDQLAAREANLDLQAAQLARKAALLAAAEAKLDKMRSCMASQASLLLQQSKSGGRAGGSSSVGGPYGRRENGDSSVFTGGGDRSNAEDDDSDRGLADTSPLISTAASLLPSSLHGSLRLLEAQRRRLHLPGTCGLCACCFSGGGTTGVPRRLRRNAFLTTVAALMLLFMLTSFRAVA
ncbi:conserved hypothetical protein [Leishmania major strain Friedlin]|uniref:Uncharacterized protein n=1 Tax=Leishmania major TaxID=5664 RepID=Q4QH43_LEIMA|nr:conserved hypothetical protein [Leishmania major strain Friedlin]CAG9570159.1 hypothetical_protein_-_conserved [Leishmania major strain Friedlin]CAJ02514.1 conserved hypothetical protein [Leishmania major strain Friedlin]|eukprot:XP_001681505.1 conserved hypothetical protein [Leishmania major strain Friedlin]